MRRWGMWFAAVLAASAAAALWGSSARAVAPTAPPLSPAELTRLHAVQAWDIDFRYTRASDASATSEGFAGFHGTFHSTSTDSRSSTSSARFTVSGKFGPSDCALERSVVPTNPCVPDLSFPFAASGTTELHDFERTDYSTGCIADDLVTIVPGYDADGTDITATASITAADLDEQHLGGWFGIDYTVNPPRFGEALVTEQTVRGAGLTRDHRCTRPWQPDGSTTFDADARVELWDSGFPGGDTAVRVVDGHFVSGGTLSWADPVGPDGVHRHYSAQWTIREHSAPTTKLELDGLEVNQAVQTWRNSVPLTEGKATYVRAFARWPGAGTKDVALGLVGMRDGNELPGSPLAPLGGILTAQPTIDRDDLTRSANFRLPPAWTHGTVTLTVRSADPGDGAPAEPMVCRDAADVPDDCSVTGTFAPVGALHIRFVAVPWVDATSGLAFHAPDIAAARGEAEKLKAILPSAQVDWDYQAGATAVAPVTDATGRVADIGSLWDVILGQLAAQRALDGCGDGCHTIYMGLVTNGIPGILLGGEASAIPSNVAVAAYDSSIHREVVAHELGHELGRHHAVSSTLGPTVWLDGSISKQGWCGEHAAPEAPDWTDTYTVNGKTVAAIGPMSLGDDAMVYGLDTDAADRSLPEAVLDPTRHFELMSYCNTTTWNWISATTYVAARDTLSALFDPPAVLRALTSVRRRTAVSGPLLVRGRVDIHSGSITFAPFEQLAAGAAVETPPAGAYRVDARDGTGALVASVSFGVDPGHADTTTGDVPGTEGLFAVPIPDGSNVATIDVVKGATVLGSAAASAHAPSVQVVAPNGGESVSGAFDVRWSAADADGDALRFAVLISGDGGTTWRTLAVDVAGSSLTVPADELPGAAHALVRVIASDGFRTASDVSDTEFGLAQHAPSITLASPTEGARFNSAQSIELSADGYDVEDGVLGQGAFTWSIDGRAADRSRDAVLRASSLSSGTHTATVTATDTSGRSSARTVEFTVGETSSTTTTTTTTTTTPAPESAAPAAPATPAAPTPPAGAAPARQLLSLRLAAGSPASAVTARAHGHVATVASAVVVGETVALHITVAGRRPILAGSSVAGARSGRDRLEVVHLATSGRAAFRLRLRVTTAASRRGTIVITAVAADGRRSTLRLPYSIAAVK